MTIEPGQHIPHIVYTKDLGQNRFEFIQAIQKKTNFKNEELNQKNKDAAAVPGCSKGKKPLPLTKYSDLGLLRFPSQTFSQWATIEANSEINIGDELEFYGFGSHRNSFVYSMTDFSIGSDDLRKARARVFRKNNQRIAFLATPLQNFADTGDSGGPVFRNDRVVAILSTVSEHCETELGEDYGLLNTATLIDFSP